MNRRPPGLKTEKCIQGFLQFKSAEGLSPRTIESYKHDLRLWLEHQGDFEVSKITSQDLRAYLVYMLNEYTPRRITGNNDIGLSPKTIRNIWVTLCAFFRWINEEFDLPNPMKKVAAPKFENAPVEPFTREDIETLLKACDYCQEAQTNNRRKFTMHRHTASRDRALILTLLDTGLRASELCALNIGDLDIKTGKVQIKHGVVGAAKGRKGRIVYLGKTARKAIWRYLANREDGEDPDAPLFINKFGRSFNRDTLRQVIHSLGTKAGIKKTHPHRFRHTFAITYLRSGGDLFTLQSLLGHSSLDMVQHYARIADIDVANAHRRASPADNWRL
jgi:integrase/recombinase XerD